MTNLGGLPYQCQRCKYDKNNVCVDCGLEEHKHTYDEYGFCFECDKRQPIPKSELNKRLRQQRKDAGLVELRLWVTPSEHDALRSIYNNRKLSALINAAKPPHTFGENDA